MKNNFETIYYGVNTPNDNTIWIYNNLGITCIYILNKKTELWVEVTTDIFKECDMNTVAFKADNYRDMEKLNEIVKKYITVDQKMNYNKSTEEF